MGSKCYFNPLKLDGFKALRVVKPSILEKMTPSESNRLFWGLKDSEKGQNFTTPSSHIYKKHFAKKLVKNDKPYSQQWSEENTAAYMGSPHHQLDDQDK